VWQKYNYGDLVKGDITGVVVRYEGRSGDRTFNGTVVKQHNYSGDMCCSNWQYLYFSLYEKAPEQEDKPVTIPKEWNDEQF